MYPKIQPIKTKEYTSKQSKYSQCAKLPMRSIVLGPVIVSPNAEIILRLK